MATGQVKSRPRADIQLGPFTVMTALWGLGWLIVALSWLVNGSGDVPARVIVLFLLLVPMTGLGIAMAVTWVVLANSRRADRRVVAVGTIAVSLAIVLAVAFWLPALSKAPSSTANPLSPTGFDQPSWLSLDKQFVVATAEVVLAAGLLVISRGLAKPRAQR